jgi:hypothetical protein
VPDSILDSGVHILLYDLAQVSRIVPKFTIQAQGFTSCICILSILKVTFLHLYLSTAHVRLSCLEFLLSACNLILHLDTFLVQKVKISFGTNTSN